MMPSAFTGPAWVLCLAIVSSRLVQVVICSQDLGNSSAVNALGAIEDYPSEDYDNQTLFEESPPDEAHSSSNHYEVPRVFIKGEVTPGQGLVEDNGTPEPGFWSEENLIFLVDTWWKLLLWGVLLCLIVLVCCYLSRCCYLIWDCCTDPFWGYCPRCQCCERLLLGPRQDQGDKLEEGEDTATNYDDCVGLGEALPQLYETQYFNWLHLFGLKTGGRCGEYSLAVSEKQYLELCNEEDAGPAAGLRSHESSLENNGPDDLSSSINFQHMGTKPKWSSSVSSRNGLNIEHGHMGKYQALPNTDFEMVPIVRSQKHQQRRLSNGYKRKSRSMESFGVTTQIRNETTNLSGHSVGASSSQSGTSRSQVDVAMGTDMSSRADKYSQTDLTADHETQGQGGLLTNQNNNMTIRSTGSGRTRTQPTQCPLPKVPRQRHASSQMEKEILYGRETPILT